MKNGLEGDRMKATHWMGVAVVTALLAASCSGGGDGSVSRSESAAPPTSVPRATPADEERYMALTRFTYGLGTNPEKMLEYGYDLCEAYAKYDGPRADVIRNWAVENDELLARASMLGSPATDYLCPE